MHLSGCSELDEESRLSQDLVDQVFGLRVNHMLRYSHVSIKAVMTGHERDETSQKYNARYRMLWKLRKRVWHKVGWPIPSHESTQDHVPADRPRQAMTYEATVRAASESVGQHPDGTDKNTVDDFLNSDPMDLLQWDEWESITAGFFMT